MRNVLIGAAAAAALLAPITAGAQPQGAPQLIFGVDRADQAPAATPVQFLYSGRQYCWYPGGWRGPGFYWCGYSGRQGMGWGGPVGWMGYSYRGGAYYQGGVVVHVGVGVNIRDASGRGTARDASARVRGGARQTGPASGGAQGAGRGGGDDRSGGQPGGGDDHRPA
jgi:hypothetical protein